MNDNSKTKSELIAELRVLRRQLDQLNENYIGEAKLESDQIKLCQVFLESLPPSAMLIRLETQEIVAANKAGRELGIVPGKICFKALGKSDKICNFCQLSRMQTEGQPVQFYLEKGGKVLDIHWVPVSDDLCLHYAYDITERKRAEEKVKRLAAFAENNPAPLLRTNLDGIITNINPAASVLFNGNLTGDLIESHLPSMVRPFGNPSSNKTPLQFEQLFGKDAYLFTVVKDEPTLSMYVYGSNITETKRLQQLESRAQRLETAGRIAGQVAHDFNNLLGPLLVYPNIIRKTMQQNPQVDSYLDAIESAAEQMTEINQQLLTLGRRGSYKREPVKLNELVLTVLKSFSPNGESITVETRLSEDIQEIHGEASQIYRALSNLLHNARDAISGRGQIVIKTKQKHVSGFTGPCGQIPSGHYIILSVKDSGVGIPDQVAQQMFNAFYSTKTADGHSGSGLGLSIVDAVMKDHNAYIDFNSQVGEGTTFHLFFPVKIESGGHATDEPVTNSGESVLVVEDDPVQRDVFVALLRRLHYRASSVSSGEQALAFLQDNPQDLLLLDMAIPSGINGIETYRRALRINPTQKALLLAGYVEDSELEIALSLGIGGFLRKPVTGEQLNLALRKELDRKTPILDSKSMCPRLAVNCKD